MIADDLAPSELGKVIVILQGRPLQTSPFISVVIVFVVVVLLSGPLLRLPLVLDVQYPTHVSLNLPVPHKYQTILLVQLTLPPFPLNA